MEVGVEPAALDLETLAVESGRDGLPPSLTRHTGLVASRAGMVPGSAMMDGVTSRDRGSEDGSDPLARYAAAAVEGDSRAVAELVRLTQPVVWRLCTALGSAGETEDLVQETYLRALKALPQFRGDAPVTLWLLSIARRTCADHVRRRQRRRRLMQRLTNEAPPAPTASERYDHDLDVIDALTPDRRDAFVLTQLIGLSYDEAAAVAGCPIGTIRSRVARARADLQDAVRHSEVM